MEQKSEVLHWKNFSQWAYAICVVTFDLELGQAMELVYPSHCELSERERANICYLAFPDSNSGLIGNVQFPFRIRMCPETRQNLIQTSSSNFNEKYPVSLKGDIGYLYGYIYFRQVKDKSLKRGYFQKSVVLLSSLPFVSLFSHIMEIIAPEYFERGEASLEAACHDIDQWLPPLPGPLTLPLHGNLIKVRIPSGQDKMGNITQSSNTESVTATPSIVIPNPHDIPAFPILAPVLPYLNLLWELILIAEPFVVMATSPTTAANMVQTLVSLISPLKYCGDYRPNFTIHDSEFKEYTIRASAPPNVILGVTNPFFAKTLQHWPHIIRVCKEAGSGKAKLSKQKTLKVVEHKPGVYTKYKPYLRPDKNLVKRLLKGVQMGRPIEVQSALLRRHLLELTQSFIIPLERYAASLMPLQKNVAPYKSTPTLRPFNTEEFLSTLESSGPQLTSGIKGDWHSLYKCFFKTCNFSSWFNQRHQEMSKKLSVLHMQAICDANMKEWVGSKCEVEVVDMVLRLREKLRISESLDFSNDIAGKLQTQIELLISYLPEDVKSVIKKS
ncbi:Protein DENND6B [Armadillidium nasatum]|uniref:Protein DENND6B n=1 Tax=Armadillidium nasatum TaxID=96803 RepID=A0A5N5TLM9_9CRUS|nr:Protein DENND6B [Armadillidium nasatum]